MIQRVLLVNVNRTIPGIRGFMSQDSRGLKSKFLGLDQQQQLLQENKMLFCKRTQLGKQLVSVTQTQRTMATTVVKSIPQQHNSPYDTPDASWKIKVRRKLGLLAISKNIIINSSRGLFEACSDKIPTMLFLKG